LAWVQALLPPAEQFALYGSLEIVAGVSLPLPLVVK
jgi:hypothetical protein